MSTVLTQPRPLADAHVTFERPACTGYEISAENGAPIQYTPCEINFFAVSAEPPEGIHPAMWAMLRSIKNNTDSMNEKIDYLDQCLIILEDQSDHTRVAMAQMQHQIDSLVEDNKTLMGRLIRLKNKNVK